MNASELKRLFGKDYPAAVVDGGVRIPLSREARFSRSYYSGERKTGTTVSRFMDGSASITFAELEREWPTWKREDRMDFCQGCVWLRGQADFPDMLRFIIKHGKHEEWSAIASSVASGLPADEAFHTLVRMLRKAEIGKSSNIAQAIAKTKHPKAETLLRKHFQSIWVLRSLWKDDAFINWVAFDATTCIAHLAELGAPLGDFEEQVRKLSRHVCARNRDSCRNFLSDYYPWLGGGRRG